MPPRFRVCCFPIGCYLFLLSSALLIWYTQSTKSETWQATFHRYTAGTRVQRTRWAYASLVADDNIMVAARVLGRSLDMTSSYDKIAIITEELSPHNVQVLESDNWRVLKASWIANPFHISNRREGAGVLDRKWVIFNKLNVFNLTGYERIIYVDADMVILRSMDVLFGCLDDQNVILCATQNYFYQQRWDFNAGMMILRPSRRRLQDILAVAADLGTNYWSGDQGLLQKAFFYYCQHPANHAGRQCHVALNALLHQCQIILKFVVIG